MSEKTEKEMIDQVQGEALNAIIVIAAIGFAICILGMVFTGL
jgi:hypothetical protein